MKRDVAFGILLVSAFILLLWLKLEGPFYKRQGGMLMMVEKPAVHTAEGIWSCQKEDYDPRILLTCAKCKTATSVILNCPSCRCEVSK